MTNHLSVVSTLPMSEIFMLAFTQNTGFLPAFSSFSSFNGNPPIPTVATVETSIRAPITNQLAWIAIPANRSSVIFCIGFFAPPILKM